jgi:hypothetical protein
MFITNAENINENVIITELNKFSFPIRGQLAILLCDKVFDSMYVNTDVMVRDVAPIINKKIIPNDLHKTNGHFYQKKWYLGWIWD